MNLHKLPGALTLLGALGLVSVGYPGSGRSDPATAPKLDAGVLESASDASSPTPPTGIPTQPLPSTILAVAGDAGVPLHSLASNEGVLVDSSFELEMPALVDVRVRLLDDQNRAIPSTDRLELGAPTRYRLTPVEPLVSGSRHALVVDGLRGDYPTASGGQRFSVLHLEFKTAGEPPEPPAKPASKKRGKTGKKTR